MSKNKNSFHITIHTERLHDDRLWLKIQKIVRLFNKYDIRATWFSINPNFSIYQEMGFDEKKWIDRLRYLAEHGQNIQQHTHFYEGKKGQYNLTPDYLRKRLLEDRNWLTKQGYTIKEFVSGSWILNDDLKAILKELGYRYDYSMRGVTVVPVKKALLERNKAIYFHDYELNNNIFNNLLRLVVYFRKNNSIILHPHDHKKKKDWRLIIDFIKKNFDHKEIKNILELGGGMGNIAYHFSIQGVKAMVEDINSEYLKLAGQRHDNISTLLHDINTRLPFVDNSFDLVCCLGTLHYDSVKDPKAIIKEIKRVSKKYILLDLLSKHAPYRYAEQLYNPLYNPRRFLRKEAEELFRENNLRVVDIIGTKTFFNNTFPFSGRVVIFLLEKMD
tara:strand:- start:11956 stop:13116 length:1161 start_codon:yes stop_codon:yes gene_type:complete